VESSDLGPQRGAAGKGGDDGAEEERSKTWLHLLQKVGESVAPVLLTAGGFVGFLAFAGSIIVWTRFQAAQVPAAQAVAAYPRGELVAVASALLLIFGLVGILAVIGFFLINREGGGSIGVSRGLLVLLAIEGLAAIILVGGPWNADRVLAIELLLLPLIVAFWATAVYERKGMVGEDGGKKAGKKAKRTLRLRLAVRNLETYLLRPRFVNRTLLGAIVVTLLSLFLVVAGAPPRGVAIVALALIGLVPTAWLVPRLVDGPGDDPDDLDKREGLNPNRIPFTRRGQALIICLLPVAAVGPSIILDSTWVVFSLLTAVVLDAALWRVAVMSRTKFIWYGLAVFVSIQLFGTITAVARNVDDPQVQPVALIRLEDGPDEAIQGIYVTETDERVYFATVATEGCTGDLVPHSGRLLWVPKEDVVAMSIGPPQSVDEAAKTALEMSYALTPAVETPAGDHVSLTVAEKRSEAPGSASEPKDRRLEGVGPAVQPNFGRGLRLQPENASPGDEVTLTIAAPNPNDEVGGFGPSRDGKTVRLGGVPVDILKETVHHPREVEYVKTINGRPLTLDKDTLYVWKEGTYVEADHPDFSAEPVFVKLTDELAVEMNDHGTRGDNFLPLERSERGSPVLASFDGKSQTVVLENGLPEELDDHLLRQSWHENQIKFRVPEHANTGAITVECEQLAGQPLLRVARPPHASISVRIEPGSRRVVLDSGHSTDNSRIVSRRWVIEGVDRGKSTRISPILPPRTQSYWIRLKVTDSEGQTGTAELHLLRLPARLIAFHNRHPKHRKRWAEASAELRKAIAVAPPAAIEFEMHPGEVSAAPRPERTIARAKRAQDKLLQIDRAVALPPRTPDDIPLNTFAFGRTCPAERSSKVGRLDILVLGEGVHVVPPDECPVVRHNIGRLPPP
jgi:hypothetical protein